MTRRRQKKATALDKVPWTCAHCHAIIRDRHGAWSRGRTHYCNKSCMEDDRQSPYHPEFVSALEESMRLYDRMLRNLAKGPEASS